MRKKIYHLIDGNRGTNKADPYVDYFITVLIILNVVAIFLESFQGFYEENKLAFIWFELISIVIFTIEYALRIWTADLLYPDLKPYKARIKFLFSFYGIIDFLSILPFFLPLIMTFDLRVLRSFRLFRLLRLFKLGRHSTSFKMIGGVLKETKFDLMITVFAVFILLIISSTLMYDIENEAQPEAFENIGQSMWWAIATLTTVGYGDVYPITAWGKFLSGIIALLGIGIVALPTGIISSAFVEKIRERKDAKKNKIKPTVALTLEEKLTTIVNLRDKNLISEEEYLKCRKEILNNIIE